MLRKPNFWPEIKEYQQFIHQIRDFDFQYLLFLREKERRVQHWIKRKEFLN